MKKHPNLVWQTMVEYGGVPASCLENDKAYNQVEAGLQVHIKNIMQLQSQNLVYYDTAASNLKYIENAAYAAGFEPWAREGAFLYLKSISVECVFRNNYNLPLDLEVAYFNQKKSKVTGEHFASIMLQDLADMDAPLQTADGAVHYGIRSAPRKGLVRTALTRKRYTKIRLNPAQEVHFRHSWSPGWVKSDMIKEEVQHMAKVTGLIAYAMNGVLGHDTANPPTTCGTTDCRLDVQWVARYKFGFPPTTDKHGKQKLFIGNAKGTGLEITTARNPQIKNDPDV